MLNVTRKEVEGTGQVVSGIVFVRTPEGCSGLVSQRAVDETLHEWASVFCFGIVHVAEV